MVVKVKPKTETKSEPASSSASSNPLAIPTITPPPTRTPNIIIRALKIMLMDIRMRIHPKSKEDLEAYSRFSELAYRRK
jgi:hypothetical protein